MYLFYNKYIGKAKSSNFLKIFFVFPEKSLYHLSEARKNGRGPDTLLVFRGKNSGPFLFEH